MKKIHRFMCKHDAGKASDLIADAKVVKQIRSVLKLKAGEEICLFDGSGGGVKVRIADIDRSGIKYDLVEKLEAEKKAHETVLYCAVLKKENFEIVVQKATEVGIDKIVPVVTKRTVKLGLKMERLQKIAQEASEQCGRITVPTISYPKELHEAVQAASEYDINLFYDMYGEKNFSLDKTKKKIGIFVGPEGGWSDEELAFIKKFENFNIVSLGKNTMRAETAAIIATYLANK